MHYSLRKLLATASLYCVLLAIANFLPLGVLQKLIALGVVTLFVLVDLRWGNWENRGTSRLSRAAVIASYYATALAVTTAACCAAWQPPPASGLYAALASLEVVANYIYIFSAFSVCSLVLALSVWRQFRAARWLACLNGVILSPWAWSACASLYEGWSR